AGLASARAWLGRARRLRARGERTAEVVALLHSAERVAELTPAAVARRLVARAEAAVDVAAAERAASARTMRRAERLAAGARDALDGNDPIRAIRRAYYAARLLDPQ
ncbi:MAG: hypothetical protein ACODAE_00770, partial [Gemmatimonadota bacterium]